MSVPLLPATTVVSDSLESCGCGGDAGAISSVSQADPGFEKRDSPPRNSNGIKNGSQHSVSSNRSNRSIPNIHPYGVELASPTPPRAYARASLKKIGTVNSGGTNNSVGASGDLSMKQQTSQRSVGTYLSVEGEDSELEPTR